MRTINAPRGVSVDIDPAELAELADSVLMPCFDGITAPDWILRRTSRSLGGVCLFARNIGTRDQVRALTDSLRAQRPDIVIAIDEEAGDVTRLEASTGSRFPGPAALGRADDVALTDEIGYQVGDVLRDAGITLNFAPSADVAVDRTNPVIGTRSFGHDPALVARHTAAFVAGHQSAGVHACVKHFPGHGDTATDSHLSVAVVDTDLPGLAAVAFPPFRAAITEGVAAVMAGHLVVPAVDDLPATLSHRWLTEILRGDMGFDGVVVTDALEMAAIAGSHGIGPGAVLALAAGADLLCLGGEDAGEQMLDEVAGTIVAAVLNGSLEPARLRDAAARVRSLAAPTSREQRNIDPDASGRVAGAALRISGPLPSMSFPQVSPALVLRCDAEQSLAVGRVPWGLAAAAVPVGEGGSAPSAVVEVGLHAGDALPHRDIDTAAMVVVLTRDRHRHPWMDRVVKDVRARHHAAVIVEMGNDDLEGIAAPAIASFGASVANGRAVLTALSLVDDRSQS